MFCFVKWVKTNAFFDRQDETNKNAETFPTPTYQTPKARIWKVGKDLALLSASILPKVFSPGQDHFWITAENSEKPFFVGQN